MTVRAMVIPVTVFVTVALIAGFLWWMFLAKRERLPSGGANQPATAVAQHLDIPWELAFLPDGSIIFTERPGRLRLVDASGRLQSEPLMTITEVYAEGEGGLLGLTLHPEFDGNDLFYVYYTYGNSAAANNKVVRVDYNGGSPTVDRIITDGIPASTNHDGGRLRFGPDGKLYVTCGDALNPSSAQDLNSLGGKVLRLNDDGSLPADNPFPGSPVYSYGHRNPEGLAWDDSGRLWETEHGATAHDEVNIIQPGQNYGWPVIQGNETAPGMRSPIIQSGDVTWAPSGMEFFNGSFYFAGLRSQSLFRFSPEDPQASLTELLQNDFGRLRDVQAGPDRRLYLLTSNRDGRAVPSSVDDQLIRIEPSRL